MRTYEVFGGMALAATALILLFNLLGLPLIMTAKVVGFIFSVILSVFLLLK